MTIMWPKTPLREIETGGFRHCVVEAFVLLRCYAEVCSLVLGQPVNRIFKGQAVQEERRTGLNPNSEHERVLPQPCSPIILTFPIRSPNSSSHPILRIRLLIEWRPKHNQLLKSCVYRAVWTAVLLWRMKRLRQERLEMKSGEERNGHFKIRYFRSRPWYSCRPVVVKHTTVFGTLQTG